MIVPSYCGAPLTELEPELFWAEGAIAVRKSRIANADDIVPSQKSVRISHTLTGQYLAFEIDRAICHHLRICTSSPIAGISWLRVSLSKNRTCLISKVPVVCD